MRLRADAEGLFLAAVAVKGARHGCADDGPLKPCVSRVVRISKAGGEPAVMLSVESKWAFRDLALDSQSVYVTNEEEVIRISRDGRSRSTIARSFGPWIAVHGDYVYGYGWSEGRHARRLVRVPKEGGEVEVVYAGPRVSPVEVTPPVVIDIAADATGIYVLDPELWEVLRFNHDGGEPVTLAKGPMTQGSEHAELLDAWSMVLTSSAVHWASQIGTWRVKKGGGAMERTQARGGFRLSMVGMGDAVYAMGPASGRTGGCSKGCLEAVFRLAAEPDQPPQKVVPVTIHAEAMAADDRCVYLAGFESKHFSQRTVLAVRPAAPAGAEASQ